MKINCLSNCFERINFGIGSLSSGFVTTNLAGLSLLSSFLIEPLTSQMQSMNCWNPTQNSTSMVLFKDQHSFEDLSCNDLQNMVDLLNGLQGVLTVAATATAATTLYLAYRTLCCCRRN